MHDSYASEVSKLISRYSKQKIKVSKAVFEMLMDSDNFHTDILYQIQMSQLDYNIT